MSHHHMDDYAAEDHDEDQDEDEDAMDDDDAAYQEEGKEYGSDSLTNLQRSKLIACQPVMEVEQNPLSAEEQVRVVHYHHVQRAVCDQQASQAFNLDTTFQPTATHCLGPKQEALCMSVSQDRSILVVGCNNGKLLTFSPSNAKLLNELDVDLEPSPCTAVRYRPDLPSSSTKNVALAAKGSRIIHYHTTSGTVLHTATEDGNTIHAIQTREDGAMYATAGTDRCIRIYDEATRRSMLALKDGNASSTAGHTNNIYSIAWKPEDWQVLLTAGWDQTVQIWDMREGKSVRSIFGAYVCGDALDVKGGRVLTGSWRHKNPLQLWDYGSGRLMTNLPWAQSQPDATLLYAAKFGRDSLSTAILSCGSGKEPMLKAHNKDGRLLGSMPLPSAGHAVEAASGKDTSTVNICCAFHILSWRVPQSGIIMR